MSTIFFHCKSEEKEELKKGIWSILQDHYFTSAYPNSNVQYDDEGETVYLARLEELMDRELCNIDDIEDGFELEFDSTEDAGFAITDNVYHTLMGYRDEGLTFLDPLFEKIVKAFPGISFEANTISADEWVYEEDEYSYEAGMLLKNGIVLLDTGGQMGTNDNEHDEEEPLTVDSIDFNTSTFVLAGFEMVDEWNIKDAIESRGGIVKDKVAAKMNYLVVPSLTMSNSKTKKVAELVEKGKDIKTITREECEKYMLSHDESVFGKEGAIKAKDYILLLDDGKITLKKYIGSDNDVVIPGTIGDYQVVALGNRCFASNPIANVYVNIISVKIPGSIEIIPDNCFEFCGKLTNVVLCEGIKTIGDYAFSDCKSLVKVEIPSTVTKISKRAFLRCEQLHIDEQLLKLQEQ